MNRKVAVAVAGVLALAAIAFWWIRRGDEPTPKPTAGSAAPTTVVQSPRPNEPDRAGNVDLGSRVMIDDDPVGTLRLEGMVQDAAKQPVAGATVVLASNPPRTTTTEADGGFAFDALVGRPYTLIARAPGGVAGPITARLTDKSDPVVLELRPGGKLTVTVVGTDGKPIDGGTVELRGTDEQRATTSGGKATIEPVVPGGYQIAAWAPKLARSYQWIQLGAGDAEAKLTLASGSPVSGRVVDDRGAPVAAARVRHSGASDWSQQANDRLDGVTTGADGTFRFDALPAGSVRFVATHPERAPGTSALVTLDGKTEHTGVQIVVETGAIVRGKVVDGAGAPIASARVRLGETAGRRMIFAPPRQTYSSADGSFELKGVPKKQLSAVALHDSGSSQTVAVDTTTGDANVKLVIDIVGTISGVVVDPQGQPLEGVQVSAGPNFADNRQQLDFTQWRLRGFPQELTDAGGHFTLTGLAPGSYTISAVPAHSAARGRRGATDGQVANTGDKDLRIVLPPEGGVKGKVAFADGSTPTAFTVSVGFTQQAFAATSEFLLDALPPQKYELSIRGPAFQPRVVEVTVESGKTADAGTVVVEKGRTISGTVVADGQPVPNANVSVGRMVFGNGTSSSAEMGPMGRGTKRDTTDASGKFALEGFGAGDLTIVAEHETIGRSRAMRLPTLLPGQTELTLTLEKFGSLAGTLRQGGKPAEGVFVTCQSTSTPGALFSVASGPDGTYRFDRLAPDVYKVSATLGMPMSGMRFYSKQIEVPAGKQVTIDLAVEPGAVTVDVTGNARNGKLGVANAYIVTGALTATTAQELGLKMAAAGAGASQWVIIRSGEPARFADVVPGAYTACIAPFPAEVKGMAAIGYGERHGDTLPAFCRPVQVGAAPASQTVTIPVELPAFIPDAPPAGSGSSGSGG